MLDIDHGTYPFVTSSSASAGGACTGTGVAPTRIGGVIGVSKAYITRVGGGPFPTEARDRRATGFAPAASEYGAVTGRPRRCGWFDVPLLRYTAAINGFDSHGGDQARCARRVRRFPCAWATARLGRVWRCRRRWRNRRVATRLRVPARLAEFHLRNFVL
jgi:hypothetical protein